MASSYLVRRRTDWPLRPNDHPNTMPQNVAHMEQTAQGQNQMYSPRMNGSPQANSYGWSQPPEQYQQNNYNQHNSYNNQPSYNNQQPQPHYDQTPQTSSYHNQPPPAQPYQQQTYSTGLQEQPNFSPFPVIRNPPPNVPPTDEQKEATLEASREPVLKCNDPETQLTWAQDTLVYVEVSQQNEQRVSATQAPRSRTPRIEHALREDAVKIVQFLAEQHHPKAEFLRGMWLEFGKFGERVDKKEAFHCYTRAAEKGYARAHYRIGMQFESSNDALKAIKYYQRGVDAGDSASCYRLGMMTLLGQHGQQQDFERGLSLIYSAAETSDENAPQGAYVWGMLKAGELPQIKVPEMYLQKDANAAKINIEKAAYLGFSKAQLKMGSAYELGEMGCPFDPALSLHYNALAARQGEADAEMAISKWFLCGHDGLFEKNEELAFTYAQRAAVNGLATAQFAMGYFYEVGIYVTSDLQSAREWYQKAKASGNPDAETRISAISRSKTLSRKDHERVALSKIRQGYGNAQNAPPMPPMPPIPDVQSPSLDMPDPSRLNLTSPGGRSPSTAPYPAGPSNIPAPNPDFRPTSAFGVNPNLRNNNQPPSGYGQPQYGPGPGPAPYQQPYDQRPGPSPGPGGYGRVATMPPQMPHQPQNYSQARPGPPPRPHTNSPYLNPQQQQGRPNQPPMPPKIDIGFSAPNDPTGADRINRPVDYSGQRLPGPGGQPPRTSSRPPDRKPLPPGPGGPSQQGQRPPPPQKQYQQKPQYPPQNVKPANIAPSKVPANPGPAPAKVSKPNTVKPNAVKPATKHHAGQGPASFEEMGIPKVKDKSDCVSTSPVSRLRFEDVNQWDEY
jgi:TPR repeat protein